MRTAVDVRPLRASAAFRRLWLGTAATMAGGQVAVVAVALQVWELTHDVLWSGATGLVSGVVTVVAGLVGGTLADAVDRRRLVLATSACATAVSLLLVAQAVLGVGSAALVLVLVGAQTAATMLGAAARRAFVARLLARELVPAGVALTHVGFQTALLAGPALGGLVVATGGFGAAYAVDAACVLVSLYGIARLPAMLPSGTPDRAGLRSLRDGLAFVVRRPVLRGALVTDAASMVLAMPVALFPAVNAERFGGSPLTYGLLLPAVGAGGLLAGLVSGSVTRAGRLGLVGAAAALVWGLALAGFGLVDGLVPTLATLAVAGAADTVSVIARGGLVQLATPDAYLGRVVSLENAVGAGGPGIGNARAGLVASLTSTSVAAVTGGLACAVLVVAQVALNPALRRWRPS